MQAIGTIKKGKFDGEAVAAVREALRNAEGQTMVVTIYESELLNRHIKPLEETISEIERLQLLASQYVDENDGQSIATLLNDISSWVSYAGTIAASAEAHALRQKKEIILSMPDSICSKPPSVQTEYIKAANASLASLASLAVMTKTGLVHRMETLRTLLSYQKSLITLGG